MSKVDINNSANPVDIEKLLKSAKKSVQIVGVVCIDLDWEEVSRIWVGEMNKGSLKITVLCESDNFLFARALISDSPKASERITFRELKFIRDRALDLPNEMASIGLEANESLDIQITHLNLSVSWVCVDEVLYSSVWANSLSCYFTEVDFDSLIGKQSRAYFASCIDPEVGRKYSAAPDDELLELFDHNRTPRGIYPRQSFYDTDYSQLVVWALVFDRSGRLLIHRRANNAKDNQGMWDKSVGGHVDYSQDIDTARAILREVVEELYEDETQEAGKIKYWAVSEENMVYLGDWRPNKRSRYLFTEIRSFTKEWAFLRLPKSQQVYSPRILPDGSTRRLRVIADVYLFVASKLLEDSALGAFKNSEFKLIRLNELKNAMDISIAGGKVANFDSTKEIPEFTPDLVNIMTGELRDSLEEFSLYLNKYVKQ